MKPLNVSPRWIYLASLVLGTALGKFAPQIHISDAAYYHAEQFVRWVSWLIHATLHNPEALWTALASCVGVFALGFIYRQLVATQDATKQTERSVDAYIDGSRGRMSFDIAQRHVPAPHMIYFHFENRGAALVTVIGHAFDEQTAIDIGHIRPVRYGQFKRRNEAVLPQGKYTIGKVVEATTEKTAVDSKHFVFISCAILYETPFGNYVRSETLKVISSPGSVAFTSFALDGPDETEADYRKRNQ